MLFSRALSDILHTFPYLLYLSMMEIEIIIIIGMLFFSGLTRGFPPAWVMASHAPWGQSWNRDPAMADVSSAALSGKTPVSFLNGQWDTADATRQQIFLCLGLLAKFILLGLCNSSQHTAMCELLCTTCWLHIYVCRRVCACFLFSCCCHLLCVCIFSPLHTALLFRYFVLFLKNVLWVLGFGMYVYIWM